MQKDLLCQPLTSRLRRNPQQSLPKSHWQTWATQFPAPQPCPEGAEITPKCTRMTSNCMSWKKEWGQGLVCCYERSQPHPTALLPFCSCLRCGWVKYFIGLPGKWDLGEREVAGSESGKCFRVGQITKWLLKVVYSLREGWREAGRGVADRRSYFYPRNTFLTQKSITKLSFLKAAMKTTYCSTSEHWSDIHLLDAK